MMKKLYSSIPLFIIGGCILFTYSSTGDDCTGMADGLIFMVLSILYVLTLTVILIISAIRYFRTGHKFNFYPFITTALLIFGIMVAFKWGHQVIPGTIYHMDTSHPGVSRYVTLFLQDDGKFVITRGGVDGTCKYKGKYIFAGDSLKLLRNDIHGLTDGLISNTYIIRNERDILYPFDGANMLPDSSRVLLLGRE